MVTVYNKTLRANEIDIYLYRYKRNNNFEEIDKILNKDELIMKSENLILLKYFLKMRMNGLNILLKTQMVILHYLQKKKIY